MSTTNSTRTITLTGRRPVKIQEEDWPTVARGSDKDWDNTYEFQANRTWKASVRVRQHEDGRAIVYGFYDYSTCWEGESCFLVKAGILLDPGADVADGIQEVGSQLEEMVQDSFYSAKAGAMIREAVRECVANLEPEEL